MQNKKMQNKRSEGKSMRKAEEVEFNQEESPLIRFLFCFFWQAGCLFR
ncbi:TPA: hypothetical protein JHK28_003494 [Enterobacter cloacae]|nr:hypothetical protein [Enterobacter cloacae]HAV2162750.1 hypothetical protein [Enterobacter cloacae]HCM9153612.1 hypothetical protein [Enterobacter cloacae subsp. cloacae]